MLEIIFLMFFAHALADGTFQPERMSIGKHRYCNEKYNPFWYQWLFSHAMTHGGFVYLATNNVSLGIAEFIAHSVIDFLKTEGWIGCKEDQVLHIFCKCAWIFVFLGV